VVSKRERECALLWLIGRSFRWVDQSVGWAVGIGGVRRRGEGGIAVVVGLAWPWPLLALPSDATHYLCVNWRLPPLT
jgi:hypothetical protein